MSFQPIKKLLPQAIRAHGISKQIEARQVLEAAATVLQSVWGDERARYAFPLSFREGTLKLESTSAAAMQQLQVDRTRIMNEINRRLGERSVLRLDVRAKGF